MNLLKTFASANKPVEHKQKEIDARVESTKAAVMEALGTDELSDALADAISGVLTQFGGVEGDDEAESPEIEQILDFVRSTGEEPATQNEFNKAAQAYREELEASDIVYSNAEWSRFSKEAFSRFETGNSVENVIDNPEGDFVDVGFEEPPAGGELDFGDEEGSDFDGESDPADEVSYFTQDDATQDCDEYGTEPEMDQVDPEIDFEVEVDHEENEEGWPATSVKDVFDLEDDFKRAISLKDGEENGESTRGWADGWRGAPRRTQSRRYKKSYDDAVRVKTPKVRTSQEEEEAKQGWVDAVSGIKPAKQSASYQKAYSKGQENGEENLSDLVATKRELTKQTNQKAKEFEQEGAEAFKKFNSEHNQAPYCQQTQSEECTAWLRGWKKAAKSYYGEEQPAKKTKRKKS